MNYPGDYSILYVYKLIGGRSLHGTFQKNYTIGIDCFDQFLSDHRDFSHTPEVWASAFPDGKKFALNICDDTDRGTVEDIKPAYDFLYGPGFLTTKTVWILPAIEPLNFPNCGESLSDSAHADFILDLKEKGFEIALHGCRGGSTRRAEIINSPEKYNDIIGDHPKIHINHNINKNNFYWGADRLDLIPLKIFYTLLKGNTKYYGHIPESEYFWDDFAQQHISYVGSWKEFYEIASRNNSMYFKKPVYYSPLNSSQT